MQRGVQARALRQSRTRPQASRVERISLSQTMPTPVLNDGRECPKRRYSLSQTTPSHFPECPKRRPVEAIFGGPPVLSDGTHIVYQSPFRSEPTSEHAPQTTPRAPDVDRPSTAEPTKKSFQHSNKRENVP